MRGLKEGFRRERGRMRESEKMKEEEEARSIKMEKMEFVIEKQRRQIGELQKRLEVEGARLMKDMEVIKKEFKNNMVIERSLWERKMEELRNKVEAEMKKRQMQWKRWIYEKRLCGTG